MFFCDFCENFKSTLFINYFWLFKSLPKNDISWDNSDFNANTDQIFVCRDNFEAAIQNNLTKSWRFSREMFVVGFRYSESIVFGIRSNFTYDKQMQVFFKIGVLKSWPSDRQLY